MAKKKLKKPTKKKIAEMKAEFRAWELAHIHDLVNGKMNTNPCLYSLAELFS